MLVWYIEWSFTDDFNTMFVIDNQILLKQALAASQTNESHKTLYRSLLNSWVKVLKFALKWSKLQIKPKSVKKPKPLIYHPYSV